MPAKDGNDRAWREFRAVADLIDVRKTTRAFLTLAALVEERTGMALGFEHAEVEAAFVRYQDLARYVVKATDPGRLTRTQTGVILCAAMLQRMHEVFGPKRMGAHAHRVGIDSLSDIQLYFCLYFCVEMFVAVKFRIAGQAYVPDCSPNDLLLVERVIRFAEKRGLDNRRMSYQDIFDHLNGEIF